MGQVAVSPDRVRAVIDSVLAQPAYDWEAPPSALGFLRAWMAALRNWLDRLSQEHPAAFYALALALTVLLVAILTHFGYLIWRALRARPVSPGTRLVAARAPRDEASHLAEFERCLAEGRYAEALAARFAALVLALGRRAVLRPDQSKTPAEYAAEARLDAAARSAFESLVDELYRRLFGGERCTADDVRRFDLAAGALGGRVAAP